MKASIITSFDEFILQQSQELENKDALTDTQLNELRRKYIEQLLQEEMGELTEVENSVIRSVGHKTILSGSLRLKPEKKLTFGEKLADKPPLVEAGLSLLFSSAFYWPGSW